MAYVGLPEDAVVYEGLPAGATIVAPESDVKPGQYYGHAVDSPEYKKNLADFLKTGTQERSTRKKVADFIRPTLEGGGMVLTAIGGPAVEGVGYAAGKRIADLVEGKPDPVYTDNPWLNPFLAAAQDAKDGATMAMGGRVVGKALEAAAPYVSNAYQSVKTSIPGTTANAEARAAKYLQTIDMPTAVTPETAALNRGLPHPFTTGEASGKETALLMEKKLAANDMITSDAINTRKLENAVAATNRLENALPPSVALPEIQTGEETGRVARAAIAADKAAAKKEVSAAYDAINTEYEHPLANFTDELKAVKSEFVSPESEATIARIENWLKGKPQTTQTALELDKALTTVMKANANGDKTAVALAGRLRSGVRQDFANMGEAAQRGDIAIHVDPTTGRQTLVVPSKLQGEIADLTKQAEFVNSQGASLKERNATLQKFLAGKGETVMQNNGITDEQFAQSLADRLDYAIRAGKALPGEFQPLASGINADVAANIQNGITAKQAILDNLQPAEDVAAQYANAHGKARAYFDKFDNSEINKVLKYGDTIGGGKVAENEIPGILFTREGAKQTRIALGAEKASALATPHVEQIFANEALTNGVLDLNKAAKLLDKHSAALETLGLKERAKQLIRDQIPDAIKAHLQTIRDLNPDYPVETARQAAAWALKNARLLRSIDGNNALVADMKQYADTLRIIGRRPRITGSDTVANKQLDFTNTSTGLKVAKAIGDVMAFGGVGHFILHGMTGGPGIGAAVIGGGIRKASTEMAAAQAEKMTQVLTRITLHPEQVSSLMSLVKGKKISAEQMIKLSDTVKSILGYTGGVLSNPTSN